jgi:Phosphopantetheine attachment site
MIGPSISSHLLAGSYLAEVLKVDPAGRHDNSFDLGGHSLLAVRLILRLQKSFPGEPLPIGARMLEAQTVGQLGTWLATRRGHKSQIHLQVKLASWNEYGAWTSYQALRIKLTRQ